ncbi:beta adaptin, putative [Theileria annulata]|uniref:Beta adaptin, putative n=1 Tax=Theileria annulata TaxID=5874 RepID=Q4UE05_THEAN|nr:beta adaptin, putative [Theileria annulata]CAI74684.1 beta adaptin, putative [Theileria annulata]|eukprot:XP_952416.1 beta adaptin, putative [Theileria annulata]
MDKKYFKGNRRSELQELRHELQTTDKDKQKEAIKKVICAMTTGKDVSTLFPDVVNCIQTNNIELKKLVYLYVINYAKVQPELAILAVNTFCKDSTDRNPLIRALAIRTMGYIRLTAITEYLIEPLKRSKNDPDPYVRKTAAICISKLYGISPTMVYQEGLLEVLQGMLSDPNPMVISNAVATLMEISELSNDNLFVTILNKDKSLLERLLSVLNECIEWGQVYILDALVYYNPPDSEHARKVIEAVCPRFSHINPAVVMSAIKVVVKMMNMVTDKEYLRLVGSKLSAPLVTLSSLDPEIQYVALRSILVVISKYPRLLEDQVRSFFCKCTDPLYVNIEKLDIMVNLANSSNYSLILNELREYATDVDLEFVRRSIRAISTLCIRLELALNSCVNALTDLLRLKINYVTEECTIALRDILRTYPRVFSYELFQLCSDVEDIYRSEAKAALIWIVGQYASEIEDSSEYISNLSETFHDETHSVQLSLLTAAMKVHLSSEDKNDLISHVIHRCGIESRNPDVRDRAYMYLRLLDSGTKVASKVVLSALPPVGEGTIDKNILDDLLENLGRVSSVYHLPSWAVSFKDTLSSSQPKLKYVPKQESSDDDLNQNNEYFLNSKDKPPYVPDADDQETFSNRLPGYFCTPQVVLSSTQRGVNGQLGLEITAFLCRQDDRISLQMRLLNNSSSLYELLALQFNKNSFGLAPSPLRSPLTVQPGKTAECQVPLVPNHIPSNTAPDDPITIQVAIKTNLDVFYFFVSYDLPVVFKHDAKVSRSDFESLWQRLQPKEFNHNYHHKYTKQRNTDGGRGIVKALQNYGLYHVGTGLCGDRSSESEFFYTLTTNSLAILAKFTRDTFTVKCESSTVLMLFAKAVEKMLS